MRFERNLWFSGIPSSFMTRELIMSLEYSLVCSLAWKSSTENDRPENSVSGDASHLLREGGYHRRPDFLLESLLEEDARSDSAGKVLEPENSESSSSSSLVLRDAWDDPRMKKSKEGRLLCFFSKIESGWPASGHWELETKQRQRRFAREAFQRCKNLMSRRNLLLFADKERSAWSLLHAQETRSAGLLS